MKLTVLLAALALAGSCVAYGQEQIPPPVNPPQGAKPTITGRQLRQQSRIKEGVKSGELTRKETRRLEAEQRMIQKEKKIARADGKVTKRERALIMRDQNKVSRDIYRQKHDAQKRK